MVGTVLSMMAQKKSTSKSAKLPWEVENIRVTAFPRFPERAHDCGTWSDTIGREPDARQERPNERAIVEAGEFYDAWLAREVTPARIDWRFTIKVREDSPPSGLPSFGPFETVSKPFVALMKRWLKTVPPINRLAFGAVLLLPTHDRRTGYETLDQLLPGVQIDPVGMSDFSYRVNRRRLSQSKIRNLQINRLSIWSVFRVRAMQIRFSSGQSDVFENAEPLSACRLELDINTIPEFPRNLPKKYLSMLFQELVDLADEITELGDTP